MPFLFSPPEDKRPKRPLAHGGPLFYSPSNLAPSDVGKLVQVVNERIVVCPDGSFPDGILERIEPTRDNLAGVSWFETVWDFPLEIDGDPPKVGACLLVAVKDGTAVKVLPASEILAAYELLEVDLKTKRCSFRFPGDFHFGGDSIIFA